MLRGYPIASIALIPILLAQGVYVRRVTPKLPEPPGPRQGTQGAGESLRLLILGDSAAAGVGAESQATALSGQLAAMLSDRFQLSWRLNAASGLTLRDVVDRIASAPPDTFDAAVVSVGVNDVTGGTSLGIWRKLLDDLCRRLHSRFGVRRTFLTCIPPMHLFPALPQPLRWFLGHRAASLNRVMRDVTLERARCECIRPEFPMKREYFAADGFHPGHGAYTLWAAQTAAAIKRHWP